MSSNMIYIVAFGGGFKCPRKIQGRAGVISDSERTFNPILTRGADYAHQITTRSPGFSGLCTALLPKVFLL